MVNVSTFSTSYVKIAAETWELSFSTIAKKMMYFVKQCLKVAQSVLDYNILPIKFHDSGGWLPQEVN